MSISQKQKTIKLEEQKATDEIDFQKQIFNRPEEIQQKSKSKIINQIDINDKAALVSTIDGLYLISLSDEKQEQKEKLIDGQVWDAVFIHCSNYIAYCKGQKSERQNLYVYDLKQNKVGAKLKVDTQIESIKTSKGCIALNTSQQIYIIHFPSLKPLYNGPAGNNLKITMDISLQGLTLAHDSFTRGELIIHNFTNIRFNDAVTERKKSIFSSRLNLNKRKPSDDSRASSLNNQQIQPIIKVEAHIDMLAQIKVSPNGSKVVTASVKGTVMRVFSTKNGEKLEEFRIGYDLVKIFDIGFVKDGNMVGCISAKGYVSLFNVQMDKQEKQYQTQRTGHKIYTQSNPKSFFSFLSFLYAPLNDSHPFNYFQLINPEYSEEKKDSSKQLLAEPKLRKSSTERQKGHEKRRSLKLQNPQHKNHHSSIQELDEEHHQSVKGDNNDELLVQEVDDGSVLSEDTSKKFQNSYGDEKSQKLSESPSSYRNRHASSLRRKLQTRQSQRQQSIQRKNGSLKKLLNRKQPSKQKRSSSVLTSRSSKNKNKEQTIQKPFQRPFYNTISKLYINEANYIWAVKGYNIFGLKYDAFHGGEMVLDRTIRIQ